MTILEACLAKPYSWLSALHVWLVHVGKRTDVYGFKLIAFLLAIPAFEARYLLFQLLYFVQERRLRVSRFHEFEPSINHRVQKLAGFGLNLGGDVQRLNALTDIKRRLEAANRASNRCHVHHEYSPPNWAERDKTNGG